MEKGLGEEGEREGGDNYSDNLEIVISDDEDEDDCVYNCIITYTPFRLFQVASLFPIAPATDPCWNTRNPTNQIAAHRSARANQTPTY